MKPQVVATAGVAAVVSAVVLVTSGFANGGTADRWARPGRTVTATGTAVQATVTVTATATVTVPGPTTTVTVPGPTVTATETVTTTPAASSPTPTPTAGPVVKPLTDFTQQLAGLYVPSGTLLGNGVDQTIYRLPAHTSTKTDPSSGTNNYELIRLAGTDAGSAAAVDVGGFTLEGTDQTPSLKAYNGMILGHGTGSKLHDVKVTGIPGYSSSPPGETFAVEVWRANSSTLTNVTLDGYRTSDGTQVGATMLGYSYSTGTNTITNLKATNARYGFGVAMYQAAGSYTFTGGCDLSHNRKAINIEESIGGTVYNFNGCDFRSTSTPYVAQITSLNSSSKVYFRDPVVDTWPLKVNTYGPEALEGRNKQLDTDIRLIVNGVDVTNDPTKLQITHL